ncbi:MAG: hypothetical protein AAGA70_07490 [Pseudomonadota bacterium]
MNAFHSDTGDALARLEAALKAPNLPPREAERCAHLVERLTRPVRVGIFGLSTGGDDWLLTEILGPEFLPEGPDWPTLEVVYGDTQRTFVTFEDGVTNVYDGPPDAEILSLLPVFLRLEVPLAPLARMSFLYLATDDTLPEQLEALSWAEARTDIAMWTTAWFSENEAQIWAQAPDQLKNHAILVATGPGQSEAELTSRAGFDFDAVYIVPRSVGASRGVERLLARLNSDIHEARSADLDAAHLFLHRLGHLIPTYVAPEPQHLPEKDAVFGLDQAAHGMVEAPGFAEAPVAPFEPAEATPAPAPAAAPAPVTGRHQPSADAQILLSEPLLYLKRRARALLEMLEWREVEAEPEGQEDEAWPEEVLTHCCETTEGLQSRAMDWPEDDARALTLRRTVDEACDVAILLQVEGGPDQAEDAATMLLQLREDIERELAA